MKISAKKFYEEIFLGIGLVVIQISRIILTYLNIFYANLE